MKIHINSIHTQCIRYNNSKYIHQCNYILKRESFSPSEIAARVSDLIDRYCYSISGQIIAQNLMDLFTVCHKQRTNRLVLLCDIPT